MLMRVPIIRVAAISVVLPFLMQLGVAQSTAESRRAVEISVDAFVNTVRNSTALCLGQFEIVDFPRGRMTVGVSRLGKANTRRFSLQFSKSTTARIYIYPKDVTRTTNMSGPCNVNEEARSKAVLAGRVSDAVILGWMQGSESGITGFSIPALVRKSGIQTDGLSLVASEVTPDKRSVLGGTIEIGKTSIAIDNKYQDLDVTESSLQGVLRLRSGEAHLTVPVGFTGGAGKETVPFDLITGSNADLKLDLTSAATILENGKFRAPKFSLKNPGSASADFVLGRLKLVYNELSANEIFLTATEEALQSSLENVTFAALRGIQNAQPQVDVTDIKSTSASSVEMNGQPSALGIELRPKSVKDLKLISDKIQINTRSLALDGSGTVDVASADERTVTGKINYDSVSAKKLGGVAETALLEHLIIKGLSSTSAYSGTVAGSLKKLLLGRALLTPAAAELGGQFTADGNLALNIKDVRMGGFALTGIDGDSHEYEAVLAGVDLRGSFSPASGILTFPSRTLNIKLRELKAPAAKIIGGTPYFSPELMQLQNASSVTLDQDATNGSLDFSSKSFSIKDPTVWTKTKNATLPLGGDLSTSGSTALKAFLGSGQILPVTGLLALDNINITLPDGITSVTFRISGLDVEVQYLKIRRFEIRLSLDPANLTVEADLTATTVELGVGNVAHSQNPVFQGTATAPVTADSLSGGFKLGPDPLQFTDLSILNGSVKLKEATYSTPDPIQFRAGTAALMLGRLTETDAQGSLKITDAHVHVEGADTSDASVGELTLTFAGSKSDPIANGNVRLDTINFVSQSGIKLDNCGDNHLPIRLSLQAGGLAGPMSISSGKTSFRFASNDAQVQLFRPLTPLWQCEWDAKVGEIAIPYPCCEWCGGFLKYPCNCRVCQTIIEIKVRWQLTVGGFQSSGLVTQIKLKADPNNGIKPCEGHMTQLNPPLVGTFALHPTIPGGNIVSDGVRDLVTAAIAPGQTAFANAAGSFGSLVSLTHIGDSFYMFGSCD